MKIIAAIQTLKEVWSLELQALDFSVALLMLLEWNDSRRAASFAVDLHDIARHLGLKIQAIRRSRTRLVDRGFFEHPPRSDQYSLGPALTVSRDRLEESETVSGDRPRVSVDRKAVSGDRPRVSIDRSFPRARVGDKENRERERKAPLDFSSLTDSQIEARIDEIGNQVWKLERDKLAAEKVENQRSLFHAEPELFESTVIGHRIMKLRKERQELGSELAVRGGLLQLPPAAGKSTTVEASCPDDFGEWWRDNFATDIEPAELVAEWKENAASRADYKIWKGSRAAA